MKQRTDLQPGRVAQQLYGSAQKNIQRVVQRHAGHQVALQGPRRIDGECVAGLRQQAQRELVFVILRP